MDIDYKEIAQTIKRFWAGKGITIQQAAEMLGISAQAVCNQLSGKPISPKTAKMYHSIWGFNEDYMITGRGTLLGVGDTPTPMDGEIRIPRETLASWPLCHPLPPVSFSQPLTSWVLYLPIP